jgi:tRNA(His) 5'-end guanylyltransferase
MIDKMGDRLKYFEGIEAGRVLIPHLPICVRVDGRAFHTFTRGMKRPYDIDMSNSMIETMKYLVEKTNACIGYVQSDEISLILSDAKDPMFGGRVQKLTSVIASMATAKFNQEIHKYYPDKPLAEFDCRVWAVPSRTEAANTILWREYDAIKNSISMAARAYYSDKQCLGKNSDQKKEMLKEKNVDWDAYPGFFKRGTYARRITTQRKLTVEEISQLPERHNARQNPDLLVTRSEIKVIDNMPYFEYVTNREAFIFDNAEPELPEFILE